MDELVSVYPKMRERESESESESESERENQSTQATQKESKRDEKKKKKIFCRCYKRKQKDVERRKCFCWHWSWRRVADQLLTDLKDARSIDDANWLVGAGQSGPLHFFEVLHDFVVLTINGSESGYVDKIILKGFQVVGFYILNVERIRVNECFKKIFFFSFFFFFFCFCFFVSVIFVRFFCLFEYWLMCLRMWWISSGTCSRSSVAEVPIK